MNLRFFGVKLFRAVVTLLLVVTFAFVILRLSGDPVEILLGDDVDQATLQHYRELYGLDRPLPEQYLRYFGGIARGDLGFSLTDERAVTTVIAEAVPATLLLGFTALLISLAVGVPLGIIAALNRNKIVDRFVMTFAVFGFSIPNFFLGILLILLFSLWLRWLPSSGMGTIWHLIMPAVTLGLSSAGSLARFTRSSMLDVLNRSYVRTAAAKGVPRLRRIAWHALPNAAIPLVTVLGFRLGDLIAGAIVTETVFAWPGVGRLLVSAVSARDLAVVQGVLLMTAVTMITANLLVDLIYGWIDPRIRTAGNSPGGDHA
ncbi:MAG: ABC transporter permease [Burkholderiales bacterium]|jgi:peptide/nickel transport system permease protein|nr:ABC transporter permease [Burkholderiales bacterium]